MSDTRTKLLEVAEQLTQTKGFNGFSYSDLATEVGVKTSSIHYYFKLKDDLAAALIERVHERHTLGFQSIEAEHSTVGARLQAVVDFFKGYIADQKFCLCGMMAAELQSVSERVATLVQAYFEDFKGWLKRQFEEAGEKDAERLAIGFLSALEGSLLLGRLNKDPEVISDAMRDYIRS